MQRCIVAVLMMPSNAQVAPCAFLWLTWALWDSHMVPARLLSPPCGSSTFNHKRPISPQEKIHPRDMPTQHHVQPCTAWVLLEHTYIPFARRTTPEIRLHYFPRIQPKMIILRTKSPEARRGPKEMLHHSFSSSPISETTSFPWMYPDGPSQSFIPRLIPQSL